MKTRFGGKPPTTSYASKFAYQQEQCREKFEGGGKGKKSRGKGAKGFDFNYFLNFQKIFQARVATVAVETPRVAAVEASWSACTRPR